MSVYNDMASDAGYKYGSKENEQMARMIEQQQYEAEMNANYQKEMEAQAQAEYEAMANEQAQAQYMQGGGEGQ